VCSRLFSYGIRAYDLFFSLIIDWLPQRLATFQASPLPTSHLETCFFIFEQTYTANESGSYRTGRTTSRGCYTATTLALLAHFWTRTRCFAPHDSLTKEGTRAVAVWTAMFLVCSTSTFQHDTHKTDLKNMEALKPPTNVGDYALRLFPLQTAPSVFVLDSSELQASNSNA
jgi:hypothetical protein